MNTYLSVDIGTTCCKCQLFDPSGSILAYHSKEYSLKSAGGELVVDLEAIRENVFSLIRSVTRTHAVSSICFSSFGETFAALDKSDELLFDPLLYTDPRGGEQAARAEKEVGGEEIFAVTGTVPHAMYSLYKLLWLRENRPELYERIDKVLLICDYFGYLLTGERVIDYSLAARTGLFDIHSLEFSQKLCEKFKVEKKLFSSPRRAGSAVASFSNKDLGLENCLLVLGAHDQVCTALGAGITEEGSAVDGLGTVECINVIYKGARSDYAMGKLGFCCLPYAIDGLYCSYIVTYSCGSVIKWFKDRLLHGYKGGEENVYAYLEKEMPESTDLFLLPLFCGSMIPYQDLNARGALIGLTTGTRDGEIYRAILEGLALEMRFECGIAEKFGIRVRGAVATGGGANSSSWLQIKADVQKIPYKTLRSVEGGLCGCAVLQAMALEGLTAGEACEIFVQTERVFEPRNSARYEEKYAKYTKLYDRLKEFF